jgi:methyl-accepting chemotaxis protein
MSVECSSILSAKDAIATHIRWKITLQFAIERREPLSANATRAIEHPDECCIGRWLLSPRTLGIRRRPEYLALVARHGEFHREMIQIARLIAREDYPAAERALGPGGGFQKASVAIANAITAVDRVQAIVLAD